MSYPPQWVQLFAETGATIRWPSVSRWHAASPLASSRNSMVRDDASGEETRPEIGKPLDAVAATRRYTWLHLGINPPVASRAPDV